MLACGEDGKEIPSLSLTRYADACDD
jgi:hypothetical protein